MIWKHNKPAVPQGRSSVMTNSRQCVKNKYPLTITEVNCWGNIILNTLYITVCKYYLTALPHSGPLIRVRGARHVDLSPHNDPWSDATNRQRCPERGLRFQYRCLQMLVSCSPQQTSEDHHAFAITQVNLKKSYKITLNMHLLRTELLPCVHQTFPFHHNILYLHHLGSTGAGCPKGSGEKTSSTWYLKKQPEPA